MLVYIKNAGSSVSVERLAQVEERLGVHFAVDYRSFLLKHNGGIPSPNRFKFKEVKGDYSDSLVYRFLAIDTEKFNLEREVEIYAGRIPDHLVPIAADPFGNVICIAVAGPSAGAVYFWDHEEEGDVLNNDNVYLIADTFTEFLDLLS